MPRGKKKTESASQSEHSDNTDNELTAHVFEDEANEVNQVKQDGENDEHDCCEGQEDSSCEDSPSSGLSLNVLIHVRTLLETAIKRGAYKPSELSTVGKIYDVFNSSLKYIEAQSDNEDSNENSNESN